MNTLPRLNHAALSSELFKKLADVSLTLARRGHVDAALLHLVDVRASQLNGCSFCLDMHSKQARLHGERELRLYHLAAWRESPLFNARERAALAWTEALTRLAPEGISDALYAEVREQFDEAALSDLTYQVMLINAWNRAGVAFRTLPGSLDKAYGLDKAGLA
ncbi:carboxymuconolactone decarboxylase family protein [Aquincola tertiaricarbonis]|uniref:Carboxymuconolactone decarboxylase family protein n=1 Tax=Aquincola tertiaricarbonis TaxID=391953 RepID=A0ABY4S5Y1_AQUTE|nr:carboxymuconolactone decarboxylase family protein [Aquincola tertiaricarbonis]URI06725.1 carboxymuconolactone decarboxylase family protein [Aquincola tertiaricarbonis]